VRPVPSSGDAFPMEAIAARRLQWNNLPGEVSLLGGELALPLSGGSHQPLDRQVRYYIELSRLASGTPRLPASGPALRRLRRKKNLPNARNATLNRVAFPYILSMATGLPNDLRTVVSPPYQLQTCPTGLPFEGRFYGGCSCRASALLGAGRNFSAACTSLALI
jgi:hypothetical protein